MRWRARKRCTTRARITRATDRRARAALSRGAAEARDRIGTRPYPKPKARTQEERLEVADSAALKPVFYICHAVTRASPLWGKSREGLAREKGLLALTVVATDDQARPACAVGGSGGLTPGPDGRAAGLTFPAVRGRARIGSGPWTATSFLPGRTQYTHTRSSP